ncbi:MAG: SPFH/Band 7/PHB domain protein [Verrucomicrobiales bacterium]|nr:SPFH/Band 7/PHB domain protein [Verrucomicrobiales bacterium]
MEFLIPLAITFFGFLIGVPIVLGLARFFRLYTTVGECKAKVFVLFGKVVGVIDQPGLHFLLSKLGPKALLLRFFGRVDEVDLRLDQVYLRSQAVNSEEGTPMGIGVWYEMKVSNPVDYLFKNNDPRGSLRANVTNATVRCLNNKPLEDMLTDRHGMSRMVRADVSPKSENWGYTLGSVYIRKVHFRDAHMIDQIEQKVVNRLRQVTSAIMQAGKNQVDVITSKAEKEAAVEFAKASAMRPEVVGKALASMSSERDVLEALFEVLEVEQIVKSDGKLTLVPKDSAGGKLMAQLIAAEEDVRSRTSGGSAPPILPNP